MHTVLVFTFYGEKNFLVQHGKTFLHFVDHDKSVVLPTISIRPQSLRSPVLPLWYFSAHVFSSLVAQLHPIKFRRQGAWLKSE